MVRIGLNHISHRLVRIADDNSDREARLRARRATRGTKAVGNRLGGAGTIRWGIRAKILGVHGFSFLGSYKFLYHGVTSFGGGVRAEIKR
jgi:hypothetical protein